jgi:hypothetical protein
MHHVKTDTHNYPNTRLDHHHLPIVFHIPYHHAVRPFSTKHHGSHSLPSSFHTSRTSKCRSKAFTTSRTTAFNIALFTLLHFCPAIFLSGPTRSDANEMDLDSNGEAKQRARLLLRSSSGLFRSYGR